MTYHITDHAGQRVFSNGLVTRQRAEEIAAELRYDGETLQVRRDGIVVTLVNDRGIQQVVS